jgi:hypothetical protein
MKPNYNFDNEKTILSEEEELVIAKRYWVLNKGIPINVSEKEIVKFYKSNLINY